MYERGAKRITSINPWLRFYFIRLANKTMFTKHFQHLHKNIDDGKHEISRDVCVKNLLFMYKVSTYFCRQCLNGLDIPSVWILTMTRLTVPSHGRWSPRSSPLLRPARHRG